MGSYQEKDILDIVGADNYDAPKLCFPLWGVVVSVSPSPWPLGENLGLVRQTGQR